MNSRVASLYVPRASSAKRNSPARFVRTVPAGLHRGRPPRISLENSSTKMPLAGSFVRVTRPLMSDSGITEIVRSEPGEVSNIRGSARSIKKPGLRAMS